MIHCRDDYNRIQDPAATCPSLLEPGCTAIRHDEPVFLIRAQDVCAPAALRAWAAEAERHQVNPRTVAKVRAFADRMELWPERKRPDEPSP